MKVVATHKVEAESEEDFTTSALRLSSSRNSSLVTSCTYEQCNITVCSLLDMTYIAFAKLSSTTNQCVRPSQIDYNTIKLL